MIAKLFNYKMSSLLLIGVGFSSLNGCGIDRLTGQNKMVSENRSFQDFSEIKVGDNFRVEVIQAESYSVRVRARKGNLDKIKIRQNNEELKVKISGGLIMTGDMKITIKTPFLRKLSVKDNSQVKVKGEWSESVDFDVSDNARLTVEGVFSSVYTNVSDNGFVNFEKLESQSFSNSVSDNGQINTEKREYF